MKDVLTLHKNNTKQEYIKLKKIHPEAVTPARAKHGDAGYDLVALDDGKWSEDSTYIEYATGISIEPPIGYHVEVFPRSSISKTDLMLANSLGLIDNGFRGQIMCRFRYVPRLTSKIVWIIQGQGCESKPVNEVSILPPILYKKGDKIAQLVIRKTEEFSFVEVNKLSETDRNTGGFGSTDKS